MSSETGAHAKHNASLQVIVVSTLTFVVGLVGLVGADFLEASQQESRLIKVFTAVLAHSAEILASVGLIGLLLELFVRRELTGEIMTTLRALFRIDRAVADALSAETRQQIVKTTLSAHLGDNLGPAVFNALVRRYLEDSDAHRRNAVYEITLKEMTSDRTVTSGDATKVFRASEYFAISAEYRFIRMLSPSERKTLVCVFGDDWSNLIDQFKASECVLRESLPMCNAEKEGLAEVLRNNLVGINSVCAVSVKLDHKPIASKPIALQDNSVVFDLDITGIPLKKQIYHEIMIEGLIAKSARSFPILVGEPTCTPVFVFNFPQSLHVIPLHFFTAAAPFDPEIYRREGKIRISMATDEPEEGWVFPNSGVLFTWDMPLEIKPPRLMKNQANRVDLYTGGDRDQAQDG